MEYSEFQEKIPYDPGDIFWTHIDLLRKHKTVSVNFKNTEVNTPTKSQTTQNNSQNKPVFGLNDKDKEKSPVVKKNVFMQYPTKPTGNLDYSIFLTNFNI